MTLSSDELVTQNQLNIVKDELIDKLARKTELDQKISKLATKEDFKQEVARLVTKEEFRREIEKLATKESLEIVASELLKLSGKVNNLEIDMAQVKLRLDKIETKLDDKFGLLLTLVDGIAKELKDMRTEKLSTEHALNRHEN